MEVVTMIIKINDSFVDTANIERISPVRKCELIGITYETGNDFYFNVQYVNGEKDVFEGSDTEKLELKRELIAKYWCDIYQQDVIPSIK